MLRRFQVILKHNELNNITRVELIATDIPEAEEVLESLN